MSIASEIARLQQAKADLKTAINNKGGNITTERIDQFASAVASLPSPKAEEERILTPDFSSGNHVIVPTTNKVLRRVTLTKPAQFIPENIKKDVDLCGVVGTLESGGASLDRIAIIFFEIYTNKTGSTNPTLTYYCGSEMKSKRFFTDGEGNWYTPEDVSVYYDNTYKGKANTTITLHSGTAQVIGDKVSFRVGTTPVALLLYYYAKDFFGLGLFSDGSISIGWGGASGNYFVAPVNMKFIELPDNFFDDFPYYSDPDVDYWKEGYFFPVTTPQWDLNVGWNFYDSD